MKTPYLDFPLHTEDEAQGGKAVCEIGTWSHSLVRESVWFPWIHSAGPTPMGGAGEATEAGMGKEKMKARETVCIRWNGN